MKVVNLFSKIRDLRCLVSNNLQLSLVISNLEFQKSDILNSLLILEFTFSQCRHKDLNLLVKKGKLVISSNQLSTKDISLSDSLLILFFGLVDVLSERVNNTGQFMDLRLQLLSLLDLGIVQILKVDLLLVHFISFFLRLGQQGDLVSQSLLSRLIFRLKLLDLLLSNYKSLFELLNFISLLNQRLGIQVSFRSDGLVK